MKRLDLIRIIEKTALFLFDMAATMIGTKTQKQVYLNLSRVIEK